MKKEQISQWMIKWHHELTQITGGMSIAIGRRTTRRSDMLQWAATLERLADELTAMANKK